MSFISTAGLLAFLARAPALPKLELINLNQTKVDDSVLVGILASQKFPALLRVLCSDTFYLTPRSLQHLIDSAQGFSVGFTRFKMPSNFSLDAFLFHDNAHRINEDAIQALINYPQQLL